MKNMKAAAEDIKKLAAFLGNLVEFADHLESVSSIQQAADEAKKRIDSMKGEEAQVLKSLDSAKDAEKLATQQAKGVVEVAKSESEKIVKAAKDQAAKLIEQAKVDAAQISAQEKTQKSLLGDQISQLKSKKIEAEKEAKLAEESLAKLNSELASLKARLGV